MATLTQTPPAPRRSARYSRPIYEEELVIRSAHTQRLVNRGFIRVARALYGLSVVLPIIGDQDEIEQIMDMLTAKMDQYSDEMEKEKARMASLRESSKVNRDPKYERPLTLNVKISSPHLARYARLLTDLDALMIDVDALWLNGVLKDRQHANAGFEWRSNLFAIARDIVDTEERARASVLRSGQQDQLGGDASDQESVVQVVAGDLDLEDDDSDEAKVA